MLPSLQLLEKVSRKIMSVPNRKKESKRRIHYGLFLLGYQSGLRVNEAVSFDLTNKNKQGLYKIERPKGKKERFVYIPKKVIGELKKSNWKPNQTNRYNFYHFLRKIKRELNIGKEIELSPHTLSRAFTTYQAESGLPLPLLQKLLGHKSIRTTALYWRNIYQELDNDIGDILAGKKWLENKSPKPITENFAPPKVDAFPEIPKNLKPIFIDQKPAINKQKPTKPSNYLPLTKISTKVNEIPLITPEKFLLDNTSKKINQLEINQQLASIPNKREKITEKEQILLEKIKSLEGQLKQVQEENGNLKFKNRVLVKQNQHLKSLIQQDQKTEAKIIQLPPRKLKN
jgi:hypothetical protein